MKNHSNIIERTLDLAKKHGADSADAICISSNELNVSSVNSKLEKLERNDSHAVGLRVFIGQKQATLSSSQLTEDALDKLAERAVLIAKNTPEDPFQSVTSPEEIVKTIPKLDIFDHSTPDQDFLLNQNNKAENAILSVSKACKVDSCESSSSHSKITLGNHNGFMGSFEKSYFANAAIVIAEKDGQMQRDYDYSYAVYHNDLTSSEKIGRTAAEKTLRRLGSKKIKSKSGVNVIFDNRVSSSLLGSFAGSINGNAIVLGNSYLKNHLDKQVFNENIQIFDDPHLAKGLGSKPFDGEGVANQKQSIIKDGILQTWLLDRKTAKKLNLKSTGHASRGLTSAPHPSTTNLFMKAGPLSFDDLLKEVNNGLYVIETMGKNINATSGDFSFGVSGFWIENGEIAFPVHEITLAGNMLDVFKSCVPANDLMFNRSISAPSLIAENLTIAGL